MTAVTTMGAFAPMYIHHAHHSTFYNTDSEVYKCTDIHEKNELIFQHVFVEETC